MKWIYSDININNHSNVMTPFSEYLRKLRLLRRLKQSDLAALASIKQSYLSMLETGQKQKPSNEALGRLIKGLNLSDEEERKLRYYGKLSTFTLTVPDEASLEEWELVLMLDKSLGTMSSDRVNLIKLLLTTELNIDTQGRERMKI
jgi:transcriptional regulator with XRE-family HTH domain